MPGNKVTVTTVMLYWEKPTKEFRNKTQQLEGRGSMGYSELQANQANLTFKTYKIKPPIGTPPLSVCVCVCEYV